MENGKLWYKDAVIYELHVRAFYDSDGDGVGDFRGLAGKLDYLQDLGVNTIWLLPFYPSPLKDDGYDIADYTNVHSAYGDLSDCQFFLKEAHRRGIKVITELVLNHTSDLHPWFKRARKAPAGSPERDFYVWSQTPEKYKEARIIFQDFESSNWSWDRTAQAYYWHRFYSHQPDLNFENPAVQKAVYEVLDFWSAMGVDGFRLDAVPYLYEKEGTPCENLPETHRFLKELRSHIEKKFKDRMLLAEANQWPEDAVSYFGNGDECNMAFHFPIMPRFFMAIHMEDRFPIIDIVHQTPPIPESCQWAIFLRNHDELTLEMVTDEERDYMYRVYANDPKARINLGIRRRLAPLLGNNRRKIELMNGLLFSFPGTPVLYYGDELGMGDNIYLGDRNGVRTPMQWSADKNAGFSGANPQQLYLPIIIDPEYHYETVNVEAQDRNPHSLLWWMKRMIALRKRFKAFSRGSIEFLQPSNSKVLAFTRKYEQEKILVVANLSRFVQCVELDLSIFKGMRPVEMFGHNFFPPIGDLPYFLTLGPHSFYWFTLETTQVTGQAKENQAVSLQHLTVEHHWTEIFKEPQEELFKKILTDYFHKTFWFGGKNKKFRRLNITDSIQIPSQEDFALILLLNLEYADSEAEQYIFPLVFETGEKAKEIQSRYPHLTLASLQVTNSEKSREGFLFDGVADQNFLNVLLKSIHEGKTFKGEEGEIQAHALKPFTEKPLEIPSETTLNKGHQSNTSVLYGEKYILKFLRRFQEGLHPELEIARFLESQNDRFSGVRVLGHLEYLKDHKEPATLALLESFIPNEGDAWQYTLDALSLYFERVLQIKDRQNAKVVIKQSPLELSRQEVDPLAAELINPYLETARRLGQKTAEMHKALTAETEDPAFIPEPFNPFYQRSLYQSMRNLTSRTFQQLQEKKKILPESAQEELKNILNCETDILNFFHQLTTRRLTALRTRQHGDFHLGQILNTGKDFLVIDFEGEPTRSVHSRKIKRSPLRDVAGMLRSFHYAAYTSVLSGRSEKTARPEDIPSLEPWAYFWYAWVSSAFLKAYLENTRNVLFLPKDPAELEFLLDIYLLEKAIFQMGYELNNRPDWLMIPIRGILQLLQNLHL